MGLFSKISAGLKKTRESISSSLSGLFASFRGVDEDLLEELTEILVMADVGIHTAEEICDILRQKAKEEKITDEAQVRELLKTIVSDMLKGDSSLNLSTKPSVIMVIGVNGVGKTTTIGKLANNLRAGGKKVVLGAADTFRAADAEQLAVWAERSGCEIVRATEGADPASVVFDTAAAAKRMGADVMICDTAGRLHNKKNLMDELAKMFRIVKRELPESSIETLLVLDAATGQNAVNQAREFKNIADITGIILTKIDGTAKGGVVLAIENELKIPVKYIGVGEQIDDLRPFDAAEFTEALFE